MVTIRRYNYTGSQEIRKIIRVYIDIYIKTYIRYRGNKKLSFCKYNCFRYKLVPGNIIQHRLLNKSIYYNVTCYF